MIYQATDAIFDLVIQSLSNPFDSHGAFDVLKATFPREYQLDLGMMSHAKDPERALHVLYAKRLRGFTSLTPTRRVRSRNVRGGNTLNQEWRK